MDHMQKAFAKTEITSSETSVPPLDLRHFPYLQKIDRLKDVYPALQPLIDRLPNTADYGRRCVADRYERLVESHAGTPGRCAVLTFGEKSVQSKDFRSPEDLEQYFRQDDQVTDQAAKEQRRRLFILEDLEPAFVDVLGDKLGIDPLVFSEQMNTWSSTDSRSIPFRALPSMHAPETSFTLRYFEIRTLDDGNGISINKNQMTFAVNRRKIERWRDVDLESVAPDKRHALVRRCTSFWTSNPKSFGADEECDQGWDAVILVDSPMSSCGICAQHNMRAHAPNREEIDDDVASDASPSIQCSPACLILENPQTYSDQKLLWKAENWTSKESVRPARHNSIPYHGGVHPLLPPLALSSSALHERRSKNSPLDQLRWYWTNCANESLLKATRRNSVNSAYFLLKFVAQHWSNQLELIGYHVASSEWFADEHDASANSLSPTTSWKKELAKIADATRDINDTLRKMSRFDYAMTLNIERLGVQLGNEACSNSLPLALADAQKDFLAISARLRPLRQRVADISGIANEVASLRASLKGIQDGEHGLRLSLFAAIIFPLTLIASVFSMADDYRPGQEKFWQFWAASVPLAFVIGIFLLIGPTERLAKKVKEQGRLQRYLPSRKLRPFAVSSSPHEAA